MLPSKDGLNLQNRRLSPVRSSETELDFRDKEDKIVKSSGETECPVLQWGNKMLVREGLTRFFYNKSRNTQVI